MKTEKELQDQTLVMRGALENRMGKQAADSFYEAAVNDSKRELGFDGRIFSDVDLLTRILWRTEMQNDRLVDKERSNLTS